MSWLGAVRPSGATTSIASNSISWLLDGSPVNGTYVTGDPWVVGPVDVLSVTPGFGDTANTNGSMVDPAANGTTQGYDNRSSPAMNFTYAAGVRQTFPFTLGTGKSLISTIGKAVPDTGGGATHVGDASILTCLSAPPAANSFRPPYVGTTKTAWATSQVNYGLLPGLALPSGCTAIDMTTKYGNRVLLHHGNLQTNHAQIMPQNHTNATGGYPMTVACELNRMAVACLVNLATAQSIANRLIQVGIDLYPCITGNTDTWSRQAGFGMGRKWPILFAGLMLNDSNMQTLPLHVTDASSQFKFQEDAYTYDGDTVPRWGEDCDITPGTYAGTNHVCRSSTGTEDQWALTGSEGTTNGLYELTTGQSLIGAALAARLMSATALWGNDVFFDYADRFVSDIVVAGSAAGLINLSSNFAIDVNKYGGTGNLFMKRMWETYR